MYSARELLFKEPEQLWCLPENLTVRFDDAAVETTNVDVVYSWYYWELHRQFQKTPLLTRHLIPKKRLNGRFNQDIMGPAMRDCFYAYGKKIDREYMMEVMQLAANRFYNELTQELEADVATMSILDPIEIMDHPRLMEVMQNATSDRSSVEKIYEIFSEVILDPEEFIGNPIAEATKAKLLPLMQVLQCVAVRGFVTDVDSSMFATPIMSGFVEGMTKLYYSMAEARSASKSLGLTKEPLQTAEYTSRRLQLATMTLKNLHFTDCGSTRYLDFLVTASDLDKVTGKYYYTKDGLKEVRGTDRQLIGQTLKFRSPLHCRHPDPYGICATCFGEIAYSVPNFTNIGWAAVVELAQQITQILLSNKHLDNSASTEDIDLNEFESIYLRTEPENNRIWINRKLQKRKSVKIVIDGKNAAGLGDIAYTVDLHVLNVQNISSMADIVVKSEDRNGAEDIACINVSMGKRMASFTHDALEHLRTYGYTQLPTGHYEIDLANWDYDKPFFELPLRHVNMVDFANDIIAMVIGNTEKKGSSSKAIGDLKPLRSYDSAEDALKALYALVTTRLDINLVSLECIILALSSVNPDEYDFRLPGPDDIPIIGSYNDTMAYRSGSALLAYQQQRDTLFNPVSFLIDKRPSHPMDDLFLG